jgi:hypothetical protein
VYGDTPLKRAFLERQLISKIDSISKSMHTIHLHQLAAKNIRDGFRKLREQFGNAATLINDAFANPQSILLYGSLSDSQKAHALLFGDASNQDEVLGPGTTDCSGKSMLNFLGLLAYLLTAATSEQLENHDAIESHYITTDSII